VAEIGNRPARKGCGSCPCHGQQVIGEARATQIGTAASKPASRNRTSLSRNISSPTLTSQDRGFNRHFPMQENPLSAAMGQADVGIVSQGIFQSLETAAAKIGASSQRAWPTLLSIGSSCNLHQTTSAGSGCSGQHNPQDHCALQSDLGPPSARPKSVPGNICNTTKLDWPGRRRGSVRAHLTKEKIMKIYLTGTAAALLSQASARCCRRYHHPARARQGYP
jgi:hypothetical protein